MNENKVTKDEFVVHATTPKGEVKKIDPDKFYSVVIKTNPKGKGIMNILDCTKRMKQGETIMGEELNLPNWKFEAELL